ncbi:MAG: GNAT family N-acetyltransferase [Siculibacillus sp.]
MTDVVVTRLGLDASSALSLLLAAHVQEVRGGEPPRPDRYYSEKLLSSPGIRLFGATIGDELIGFAVVHELEDCLSGLEAGLLETVFVRHDRRGRGAGRALLEAVSSEGRRRAWSGLRWIVDDRVSHSTLPERLARPAGTRALVVPITRQ